MIPRSLALGAVLTTLALPALGAAPALADITITPDATAQNVTSYATSAAWSRRADDGTYRLVIRHSGLTVDAPVPPASVPYDPDMGPTRANGRTVVYARGGDLYRYDLGAAAEQRLSALSSGATEAAPSFFKDKIAFARTTGARRGLYLARLGRSLTRLFRTVPAETDIAETRVVGRFGQGSRSIIRVLNHGGDDVRIVRRVRPGQRVVSPTLTRFNAIWVRVGRTDSTVEQVGVNAHRGLRVLTADRPLPGRVDSLSSTNIPALYTRPAAGVQQINPKLRFSR